MILDQGLDCFSDSGIEHKLSMFYRRSRMNKLDNIIIDFRTNPPPLLFFFLLVCLVPFLEVQIIRYRKINMHISVQKMQKWRLLDMFQFQFLDLLVPWKIFVTSHGSAKIIRAKIFSTTPQPVTAKCVFGQPCSLSISTPRRACETQCSVMHSSICLFRVLSTDHLSSFLAEDLHQN